MLSRIKE